jgi:hypothetical protein
MFYNLDRLNVYTNVRTQENVHSYLRTHSGDSSYVSFASFAVLYKNDDLCPHDSCIIPTSLNDHSSYIAFISNGDVKQYSFVSHDNISVNYCGIKWRLLFPFGDGN